MYCLEVVSSVPRGSASYYTLCVRQPYVVGRVETCDLHFQSQDVSRVHATLQVVQSSHVAYSYSRGGASPYRGAVGGGSPPRSGDNDAPLVDVLGDTTAAEPPSPALSLVVVNKSKFGVAVDGTVIDGSCVIPHGGVVCFGSIGLRATFRPVVVSINPSCYEISHREELSEMLRQLGATVVERPGAEEAVFAPLNNYILDRQRAKTAAHDSAAETPFSVSTTSLGATGTSNAAWKDASVITPTRNDRSTNDAFPASPAESAVARKLKLQGTPGAATVTSSQQHTVDVIPTIRPIAQLFVTEIIDGSAETIEALLRGHSIVLPAHPFELFAALAERCNVPVHKLPKPADFEPPKSAQLYNGATYMRPESLSVPFSLFGASVVSSATSRHGTRTEHTRSRVGLFNHRMFTMCDSGLCDRLQSTLRQCGAVVVPFRGVVDITKYEENGDDDPNELPRDQDRDFYEAVGLGWDASPSSPRRQDDAQFQSRRAMVSRFRDRRYCVATNTELSIVRDGQGGEGMNVTALREDWRLLARNGWTVITYDCILRALLTNKFSPSPQMPTDPSVYNNPLLNKGEEAVQDAIASQREIREHSDDDDDVLAAPLHTQMFNATAGADQGIAEVDSDATPSDAGSDAEGPLKKLLRRISERQQHQETQLLVAGGLPTSPGMNADDRVESWVSHHSAGVSARAAIAFDMQLHRLQVMIDRTILVCRDRIREIKRTIPNAQSVTLQRASQQFTDPRRLGNAAVSTASHPATLGFLRNVVAKCDELLRQLEELSQSPEGAARSLALQSQWDTCANVRSSAIETLDAIMGDGDRNRAAGSPTSGRPDGRSAPSPDRRREEAPSFFRGSTTKRDNHVMPARDNRSSTETAPRSMSASGAASRRSLAGSYHRPVVEAQQPKLLGANGGGMAAVSRTKSSSLVHDPRFANRRTADRYGGGEGDDNGAAMTASAVAPLTIDGRTGLRDRTRWARYLPPAPIQSLATPLGSGANGGVGNEKHKVHNALLIHISPMDLVRIAKHRRLFVSKFGQREGEVRFNMWLGSQTPQWTSAFVQALQAEELTLAAFIKNSA